MNKAVQESALPTNPRLITIDVDLVLAALEEARATELAAHRNLILHDDLNTKKRNRDPDHTFLAGHTGGYLIGIAKAVEILRAAQQESAVQSDQIPAITQHAQI